MTIYEVRSSLIKELKSLILKPDGFCFWLSEMLVKYNRDFSCSIKGIGLYICFTPPKNNPQK